MATLTLQQPVDVSLRRTKAQDMDSVVALDAAIMQRPRPFYFQRRLKAALDQDELHLQFSAERQGRLVGFIKARKLLGEFGREEPAFRLEAIAVEPGEQSQGIGSALLARLQSEAKRIGVSEIRTISSWRDHAMMQFFDYAGFEFSHHLVLDCPLRQDEPAALRDKTLAPQHLSGFSPTEVDYSATAANDFEALADSKCTVRALNAEDFDDILRIDQKLVGRRREAYIRELVDEAMNDTAVRVSLVAEADGTVAGMVMARTDFGDYGRAEPVAVLDTIGVDPDYAHRGIGRALLSQLFVNLEALRVERVETIVARENFGLLGFFYDAGFEPSPRLSFEMRLN